MDLAVFKFPSLLQFSLRYDFSPFWHTSKLQHNTSKSSWIEGSLFGFAVSTNKARTPFELLARQKSQSERVQQTFKHSIIWLIDFIQMAFPDMDLTGITFTDKRRDAAYQYWWIPVIVMDMRYVRRIRAIFCVVLSNGLYSNRLSFHFLSLSFSADLSFYFLLLSMYNLFFVCV